MKSQEIREKWLLFFESKGHLRLESKSLIPINDPSLLWINSGVATLKDYFSGIKTPPYINLTNSQKSLRTNDIENVGITSRHHTFFEMLGNFSIGGYFKKEAISYAYEFLIKVLKLKKNKLYITYYEKDIDTKKYWEKLGIKPSHIIKGSKEMNFWDMGMGPCGPDTEIFYDRGEKYDSRGIELIKKDLENDRYIEIWNIVFSEFNNDGDDNYSELIQKNIDTGAGLERLASIMQNGNTNFDTDLFLPIIKSIEKLTVKKYNAKNYFIKNKSQNEVNVQFKIIADHLRAVVNAIADGAKPSNTSRGYIIRRLIRRSYIAGKKLGISHKTFLYKLTKDIANSLIFEIDVKNVKQVIKNEEISFAKTITQGQILLEESITKDKVFDFAIAFKLFETYGFPIELTKEILATKGIDLDISQFKDFMQEHALLSRTKETSAMKKQILSLQTIKSKVSEFVGYGESEIKGSINKTFAEGEILKIFNEETEIERLNGKGYALVSRTPFYATSGGQRHDKGTINGQKVIDVFKDKQGNHIHVVEGMLEKGHAELQVDQQIRNGLERNHSATHLIYKALRNLYGMQVRQLGSDNNENRLTFDFPCEQRPTKEDVAKLEKMVNDWIKLDTKRIYHVMNRKEAMKTNAIILDGEEFTDNMRLVEFPGITIDVCGGTHVPTTAKLEKFRITKIESQGAGIFRITALTSNSLVDEYDLVQNSRLLEQLNLLISKNKKFDAHYKFDVPVEKESLIKSIAIAKKDNKRLNKESKKVKLENITLDSINGIDFYIDISDKDSNIKNKAITYRELNPNAVIIIGIQTGKQLLAIASKKYDANQILQSIFKKTNGRGGGNDNFAQGICDESENMISIITNVLGKIDA